MKPIVSPDGTYSRFTYSDLPPIGKGARLIKNKGRPAGRRLILRLSDDRDWPCEAKDTANQALKVKEEDSYYDFLKKMPLNDETVLADSNAGLYQPV